MNDRHSNPALSSTMDSGSDVQLLSGTAPFLGNLDGDVVEAAPNEVVFLDLGGDATLTGSEGNLTGLDVILLGGDASDVLGIHTDGTGITVDEDGLIWIDTSNDADPDNDILLGALLTTSGAVALSVSFTEAATPELVQRLIRALTYMRDVTETSDTVTKSITVIVHDANDQHAQAWVDVVVGSSQVYSLTADTDDLTGTSGRDTFVANWGDVTGGDFLDGGDGEDTLQLNGGGGFDLLQITFTGIETIQGTAQNDYIAIGSEQLAGVTHIDGGGGNDDNLLIAGNDIDLSNTTVTGFGRIDLYSDNTTITVGNRETALLVDGLLSENDHLILSNGTLSDEDRAILHLHGVDSITDESGRVTTRLAPEVTGLDGDSVTSTGNTPVHLDAGLDTTVSDDDGAFRWLSVIITNRTDDNDVLEIAASNGVTVSGTEISVGRNTIGMIDDAQSAPSRLLIRLLSTATADEVQALIQALTYRHVAGALDQDLEVKIELADIGGRIASHTVTIAAPDGNEPTNTAPQIGNLDGDIVVSNGASWVSLDAGNLASATDNGLLSKLEIRLKDGSTDLNSLFGIGTEGVGLSNDLALGSVVSVEGVEIGIISSQGGGVSNLVIQLNGEANSARISKLIQQLTYRRLNDATHSPIEVQIKLTDNDGLSTSATVTVKAQTDTEPTPTAPTIGNLDGDVVVSNGTEWVYLDNPVSGFSVVSDDGSLKTLEVLVANTTEAAKSVFRITEFPLNVDGYAIQLSDGMNEGSEIYVKLPNDVLTEIGTIISTGAGAGGLTVALNSFATPERVSLLLESLSYKRTDGAGHASFGVQIKLTDDHDLTTSATVTVKTAESPPPVGTPTISNLDGDIVVSNGMGQVSLDAGTLAAASDDGLFTKLEVRLKDGSTDPNSLFGIGTSGVSLSNGLVMGSVVTVDGVDIGMIDSEGEGASGLTVLFNSVATSALVSKLLQQLTYHRPSDATHNPVQVQIKLTDDDNLTTSATVTVKAPTDTEPTPTAPVISGVDGDRSWSAGTDWVKLTELSASITDDGILKTFEVRLKNGAIDPKTEFRISTFMSDVELSDGMNQNSVVSVKNANGELVEVGTITSTGAGVSGFSITFNNNATDDLVNQILHGVAYRRTDDTYHAPFEVEVNLTDTQNLSTNATMTIKYIAAPRAISLTTDHVLENSNPGTVVGTLKTTDPSPSDTFTYELIDDAGGRFAIQGDKLVVKHGELLDFERSVYHEIRVRVTDSEGSSLETTLFIDVDNQIKEVEDGSERPDTITGGADQDTLSGGIGDDDLYGGGGGDWLDGGYGDDDLWGDEGDDDLYGDVGNDDLEGGEGADDLWGDEGNDTLLGGNGDDWLYGGLGKNVLTGGLGKDSFVFDVKPNKREVDKVTDFKPKQDKILLDNAVYKKLGKGTELKPGKIKKDMFVYGNKAKDKNDFLIQDKGGVLYYDADGSGKGAKVAIADFDKKIAYTDLLVI